MNFKRKRKRKLKHTATDTLIGKGSVIQGNIISDTSLRIEGQVQGDITCDGDVVLGKEAITHAKITAHNVINSGTIHGAINSKGTLTIASSGKIYGDIQVASLTIASGGIFEGMSKMNEAAEALTEHEHSVKANEIKAKLHTLETAGTTQQAAHKATLSSNTLSSSAKAK